MLPRWTDTARRPLAVTIKAVIFLYGLGMVAGMVTLAFTGDVLGLRLLGAAVALWLGYTLGRIALEWWREAASRRTSGHQATLVDPV